MPTKLMFQPPMPVICFSSKAYAKMQLALTIKQVENLEFCFLGTVSHTDNLFFIEDIHIPPQTANSMCYCETDDELYPEWFQTNFSDVKERLKIRFHGHSHVNMNTSPSMTDMSLMSTLMGNVSDYFIQFIYNKKNEYTLNLYDKTKNLIFEEMYYYISVNNQYLLKTSKDIIYQKPKNFKLSDYECSTHDNLLYIGNSLTFDFNILSFITTDEYLSYSNNQLTINLEFAKQCITDLEDIFLKNISNYKDFKNSSYLEDYKSNDNCYKTRNKIIIPNQTDHITHSINSKPKSKKPQTKDTKYANFTGGTKWI